MRAADGTADGTCRFPVPLVQLEGYRGRGREEKHTDDTDREAGPLPVVLLTGVTLTPGGASASEPRKFACGEPSHATKQLFSSLDSTEGHSLMEPS